MIVYNANKELENINFPLNKHYTNNDLCDICGSNLKPDADWSEWYKFCDEKSGREAADYYLICLNKECHRVYGFINKKKIHR